MLDGTTIEQLKPEDVFGDAGVESLITKIEAETHAEKIDISTEAGRKRCASVAYQVAKTKTFLDDMGKDLVSEWKSKSAKVDGERRKIRDRLDALKEEVRKPLTDFENAEKGRVQDHEDRIAAIASLPVFDGFQPTAEQIKERIDALPGHMQRDWHEFGKRATEVADATRASLQGQLAARQKTDADQAELERLRAEQAKREQAEREERIRKDAAAEAERAAQKTIDEAKASEEAAKRAAEQERANAEKEAAAAKEREAKALIEATERQKRAAEDAAQAERDKIERERKATEKAAAEREADLKHRGKINREAMAAIAKAANITEDAAKPIVEAVAKGLVPHIQIRY